MNIEEYCFMSNNWPFWFSVGVLFCQCTILCQYNYMSRVRCTEVYIYIMWNYLGRKIIHVFLICWRCRGLYFKYNYTSFCFLSYYSIVANERWAKTPILIKCLSVVRGKGLKHASWIFLYRYYFSMTMPNVTGHHAEVSTLEKSTKTTFKSVFLLNLRKGKK